MQASEYLNNKNIKFRTYATVHKYTFRAIQSKHLYFYYIFIVFSTLWYVAKYFSIVNFLLSALSEIKCLAKLKLKHKMNVNRSSSIFISTK